MKICSKCKTEKSIEEFYKRKNSKDGHRSYCKQCEIQSSLSWMNNNPEKVKEYTNNHKKQKRESSNKWKEKNKEKTLELTNDWRKNNPDKSKEASNNWKRNNREKVRVGKLKRHKERLKTDEQYRLMCNIRKRMQNAIKTQSGIKAYKSIELLGCTGNEAKEYLESKFQTNMSWDNYGEWHVDHIAPIASFNLIIPTEQKKCFHYSNLQPLWAEDNLKKSNKVI